MTVSAQQNPAPTLFTNSLGADLDRDVRIDTDAQQPPLAGQTRAEIGDLNGAATFGQTARKAQS